MAISGAGNLKFVTTESTMAIYRRVAGRMEFWRAIRGDDFTQLKAMEAAVELDVLASELGGWAHALRLGLNPAKPVHPARVPSWLLFQNKLNGRLGKL
jgi:hypothetical protein